MPKAFAFLTYSQMKLKLRPRDHALRTTTVGPRHPLILGLRMTERNGSEKSSVTHCVYCLQFHSLIPASIELPFASESHGRNIPAERLAHGRG